MAESETSQKSLPIGWEYAKAVAQIIATIAIPIVIPISLAVYTAKLQGTSQKEALDRDYVQLAVSILKEKSDTPPNDALRTWAVDLLRSHSTIPFSANLQEGLKAGTIFLPSAEPRPFIADSSRADAFRLAVDILQFTAEKVAQRPKWEDYVARFKGRADAEYIPAFRAFETKSTTEFHKKFDSRISKIVPTMEKDAFGLDTRGAIEACQNAYGLQGVAACAGQIAEKAAFRLPS